MVFYVVVKRVYFELFPFFFTLHTYNRVIYKKGMMTGETVKKKQLLEFFILSAMNK